MILPRRFRFALIGFLAAAAVWAQSDANKASIVGRVLDPVGAAIPNATVTVANMNIGMRRQTVTNKNGQYRFGVLDSGVYDVTAEAPNFAPTTIKQVVLNVGGYIQLDLAVALQTITVIVDLAEPSQAGPASAESQLLPANTIRDLPISGRRFQDFATLTPTVQAISETRGQLSFVGQRGINSNVMVD